MAGRNRRKTRERARNKARSRRTSFFGRLASMMERISLSATRFAGSSWAFAIALGVIVIWGVTGPIFGFSDTWQLVINTGTTIVTFLMVFLIQRTQNKETTALELKLNELVAAVHGASNRLIDAEDMSERELQTLHQHYETLAQMAKRDADIGESHSVEEAQQRHGEKARDRQSHGGKRHAGAARDRAS
jgi:low affinity Fe/Cu permease